MRETMSWGQLAIFGVRNPKEAHFQNKPGAFGGKEF